MSDTLPAPTAAPEAAVVTSAPVEAPTAPVAPTPAELRAGALWRDPARRDAWLQGAAPTGAPDAPSAEPSAPSEAPAEDAAGTDAAADGATEPAAEDQADGTARFRRAGERGPKVELVDAAGQPVPLDVATVTVRTRAGGEPVELTLPELVRQFQGAQGQAQQASALQQRLHQTEQQHAQTLQQRDAEHTETTQQLAGMLLQALADDVARDTLRSQVQQYLSPQQQLERDRAALTAERETLARQQAQSQYQAVASAVAEAVAPTLAALPTQFPHVDASELAGHFLRLTAPFVGPDGTTIQPQFLPQVHAIVTQELPRLARERHDAIEARIQAARQSAQQDVQQLAAATARAQRDAQQATNALARGLRPSGAPGQVVAAPAKPPIRSLKEAQAWARASYAGS